MGVAADGNAPDIGLHRRRRPGRARHGPVARSLRDRCRHRREEPDHDRSSEVARLLGPHHGDLPAMGDRAGDPRPRPAGQVRHVRAGREHRRPRDQPLASRAQSRPDAGVEIAGGAGRGRGGDLQGHRALQPGAGEFLDRVRRLRGGRGRRDLRDPLRRDRPHRALARQISARLRRRRQPDAAHGRASRWKGRRRSR